MLNILSANKSFPMRKDGPKEKSPINRAAGMRAARLKRPKMASATFRESRFIGLGSQNFARFTCLCTRSNLVAPIAGQAYDAQSGGPNGNPGYTQPILLILADVYKTC